MPSRRRHVDRARAVGAYDGALRAIVHALKYDGRRSLARPLAELMRHRGAEMLTGADWAVPVPLHRSRRRERGFNQAADLARHLGIAGGACAPTHAGNVDANRRSRRATPSECAWGIRGRHARAGRNWKERSWF